MGRERTEKVVASVWYKSHKHQVLLRRGNSTTVARLTTGERADGGGFAHRPEAEAVAARIRSGDLEVMTFEASKREGRRLGGKRARQTDHLWIGYNTAGVAESKSKGRRWQPDNQRYDLHTTHVDCLDCGVRHGGDSIHCPECREQWAKELASDENRHIIPDAA